jgi:hypothetical protein
MEHAAPGAFGAFLVVLGVALIFSPWSRRAFWRLARGVRTESVPDDEKAVTTLPGGGLLLS